MVEVPVDYQKATHGLMLMLGGLSSLFKRSFNIDFANITFSRSGREQGLNIDPSLIREMDSVEQALAEVRRIMLEEMEMDWPFFPYHGDVIKKRILIHGVDPEKGCKIETQLPLVFRNCMVRVSLAHFGSEQEEPLCEGKHGLFCGLFEKVYRPGFDVEMTIPRSGRSACLLQLHFHEWVQERPQDENAEIIDLSQDRNNPILSLSLARKV
ncbi:MAG: hypothetical protein HQL07_07890 [Nitrospirae bacterium]|nr:hypothetical protein [Magnetococcales bacterium]HAT50521.1 hypothetical protein [Alphaproteobacteria bacterium]